MKWLPALLLLLLLSCSAIDSKKIEVREDGLVYFKGSNRLVTGTAKSNFDNGRTSAESHYENGKEIGKWYSYDQYGDYVLEGESIEFPEELTRKYLLFQLQNLSLAFVKEGGQLPYDCRLELLKKTPEIRLTELILFVNQIYKMYVSEYNFKELYILHGQYDYRFRRLPVDMNDYRTDTIEHFDELIVNVH